MRVKIIKYIIMALAIIAGIVWYVIISKDNKSEKLSFVMESTVGVEDIIPDDSGGDHIALDDAMEETNDESTQEKYVVIYVCGEVISPGVYELLDGARIISAIEAAGGFTAEAARDYLNLARIITDGEKIDVPSVEAVREGLVISTEEGKEAEQNSISGGSKLSVNINTADKEELMKLPGIGESRALAIIAYREEYGVFASIEEIMLVSGIKEGAFSKIKEYIKVKP